MLAQTLRDGFSDAVPDGKKVHRDDAPRLAEPNRLARGFLFLCVAAQSPVREFVLNSGRDEKPGVTKSLSNLGRNLKSGRLCFFRLRTSGKGNLKIQGGRNFRKPKEIF